jgi:hypothetical protein
MGNVLLVIAAILVFVFVIFITRDEILRMRKNLLTQITQTSNSQLTLTIISRVVLAVEEALLYILFIPRWNLVLVILVSGLLIIEDGSF